MFSIENSFLCFRILSELARIIAEGEQQQETNADDNQQ
jgi:hypothetical protein